MNGGKKCLWKNIDHFSPYNMILTWSGAGADNWWVSATIKRRNCDRRICDSEKKVQHKMSMSWDPSIYLIRHYDPLPIMMSKRWSVLAVKWSVGWQHRMACLMIKIKFKAWHNASISSNPCRCSVSYYRIFSLISYIKSKQFHLNIRVGW